MNKPSPYVKKSVETRGVGSTIGAKEGIKDVATNLLGEVANLDAATEDVRPRRGGHVGNVNALQNHLRRRGRRGKAVLTKKDYIKLQGENRKSKIRALGSSGPE